MRARARLIRPLLALLLAGCSISVYDDPRHDGLDGAIHDTAAEINVHYATLDTAPSLAEGRAELDRHARAMESHRRELRIEVTGMSCLPGGRDAMMGVMSSVEDRLATYLAEGAQAPTLDALRVICRQYADDMDALFDRMGDRADWMDCR